MSYLAIGAVTNAIAVLLENKLNKPPRLGESLKVQVTALPPNDERVEGDNSVNLFLYRIAESPFAKNVDWPGDRGSPGIKRPPVALTLHYLLTAYAKKAADARARDDITAHQILGNALAILHEHAVLNDVHDSDFDADLTIHFAPELRDAFDKIKITFSPISLEEFSKIWTGLSKAYRLSVAYEVSLVQIAPIVPAPMPGPPVQQTHLQVATLSAPVITALEPPAGPADAQITIQGSGFKEGGRTTSVTVGETTYAETDLVSVTAQEIVLKLTKPMQHGPQQSVIVTAGGRESAPAVYQVEPWISALQPLRGVTGIPLTILCELPAGAAVSVEFKDPVKPGEPLKADILDAGRKSVRVTVPEVTTNGHWSVVLVVNNGAPRRSNERFYEVLPGIQSVSVTHSGEKTIITITGQRLKGDNVQVRYGQLLIYKGANDNSTGVTVEVAHDPHADQADQPVSVIVDGRESSAWPPRLERIEPPEAFPGERVTLFGSGLSGREVVVRFDTIDATAGPHAYASQVSVAVPARLAAGAKQVRVRVDGTETNNLKFKVRA